MLRRVALVRTEVSEDSSVPIIRGTRIGGLRTTTDTRCEVILSITSQRVSVASYG
jgi:hypothetical protein